MSNNEENVDPVIMFYTLYEQMYKLCNDNEWGDPFSYSRAKEIYMANLLGHTINKKYSGADGIDKDGECEYKSTIGKNMNATYNGISVQETWEKQEKYLKEEKICKYKNHYFARFDNKGNIIEIYKMSGDDVFNILVPKLKKKYSKGKKGKDPRLGATITNKEIKKYGIRLLPGPGFDKM
jgi:hypothetical protein